MARFLLHAVGFLTVLSRNFHFFLNLFCDRFQ